ncbi:hypothetical protein HY024_04880 [Candidatus Curtissbacteria bacterium]|nr:hypothetical protein [Candidatus Curtissbacteria bacterium]
MNKQLGIIIGVIVVIVLGAGAYMAMSKKPSSLQNANTAQEAPKASDESMMQASMKSLLGAGKNVTCTIKYTDNKGGGTIFVSGDKFRGDFDTTTNGKEYKTHMINDNSFYYTWMDDSAKGQKFSKDYVSKMNTTTNTQNNPTANLDSKVDMKCSAWIVDNSKFVPPTNVTFEDLGAMMDKMSGGSGAPKMDASACASISDAAAKAACVSAMTK